ncbi:MAG: DNA recombination protein RmuC [Verrucomicrobiae bacterium]|nr:DNA recombination protein RmuC [Verrucomicrobiae bacterium]
MEHFLYLVVGAVLGGAIGWLIGNRGGNRTSDSALVDELRRQVGERDDRLKAAETQSAEQRAMAIETGKRLAAAEAELTAADQRIQVQEESLQKSLAQMRDSFKAMSADTLKETQPQLIQLLEKSFAHIQESAKGDIDKRQEAIKTLVKPLEEQLKTYQLRLQQSESERGKSIGDIKRHLEVLAEQSQTLSSETLQLRRVLSSNQARGRWGEETLRRVVEAAGLSSHCEFTEQTQAGDVKPDMVVQLPGERVIIIDSKVPDLDFLSALDEADETKRKEKLGIHARSLKNTIKDLADRNYPGQFANSLDYVVLFLPAESLFSAALEGDRDLIVWAAQRRILLATPASLIALLRSVAISWQQHEQTENAQKIAAAAQELYTRIATFSGHFEKMRKGLAGAVDAYNGAMGSYTRVRKSGERVLELGTDSGAKELADLDLLGTSLRPPEDA